MSATTRGRGPGGGAGAWMFPAAMFSIMGLGILVWGCLRVADRLGGTAHVEGMDPPTAVTGLIAGDVPWTGWATATAVAFAVVVVAAVVAVVRVRGRRRRDRSRVDGAASLMGRGQEIVPLSIGNAVATAQRLGAPTDPPGLPIGDTVTSGTRVTSTWEDVITIVAGPRTQKSTCYAIPFVLACLGAAVATSNKRDVVDATRDLRATLGTVWVFDPQRIAEEAATWWWNPLRSLDEQVLDLTGKPVRDAFGRLQIRPSEDKASRLVDVFASAETDPDAKKDAYFDPAARNLLKSLILAAAAGQRPLTAVYRWVVDATDETPALLLEQHGYPMPAMQLRAIMNAPDKQRQGVYGTALGIIKFLEFPKVVAWCCPMAIGPGGVATVADVVPGPGELDPAGRPQFDPHAFVRTTDTLYPLSKEGGGTAAAVLTALTAAVCEAADEYATSCGGRLPAPMVVVLDEAANICRWRALPDLYSHYGSRGIILVTIVQSPDQGAEAWGTKGFAKLWSASNVRVYGGGVDDARWLNDRATLIGEYEYADRSVSRSKTGNTTSVTHRREQIFTAADLAALPKGRAVVFASGARPVLVRTLRWMDSPHAEAIRASITAHNRTANAVLKAEAAEYDELAAIDMAAAV